METDCSNETCEELESDDELSLEIYSTVFQFDPEMIVWIVVHTILLVFIIGGNMLTIVAVRICRRLRALVSNLFILSLAVSDLIVGLTLPYHLSFFLGLGLGKSKFLCLLRFYIIIFACCISMWNLISIAVDRYIAIMYPLHYTRFITRRIAVVIIALGWIIGSLVAAIPVIWNKWDTADDCELNEVIPAWYIAGILTPFFSLVWMCMLLVYLRIWHEAAKQAKQLKTATCCKDVSPDSKSVQVVLLIMGGFTICWLPYFLVACAQIYLTFDGCPIMYRAALALAMSNSGFNPLIYAWKNSNFRKSFCLLLQCQSPNCANNSDYSLWEYCPRNGSQIRPNSALNSTRSTSSVGNKFLIQATSPNTAIVSCSPNPSIEATQQQKHVLVNLNVDQLYLQAKRNHLGMMTNEMYVPAKIFCSPCQMCKTLVAKKADNVNGIILPWQCSELNNNKIKEIKCKW